MTLAARRAIAIWLGLVLACVILIARTGLNTDMAAFLPRSPSAAQQVLVDQVQNGVVSRLILLGVEGAAPETLAALSRELANRLRADEAFAFVNNGEDAAFDREREFFWRSRYLLSPATVPERFTADGLRHALEHDLELLQSDVSVLVKRTLPNDPTGELLTLIDELTGAAPPHISNGVWFSQDEDRALLVAETRGAGLDTDAQQRALAAIDGAFAEAKRTIAGAQQSRLLETGPGVFAAHTRTTMQEDASRLSLLATILVAGVMLFAYRSPRMLLLGLLPVVSGALAGIAAVALGFGFVHGITLGFGVTLIGEAVDYAIYLFTQTAPGNSLEDTLGRIWPTLRLGMLTSIAGFSAMLFSGFAGFAQLGLFSIVGLITALGVTRWVLPALLPAGIAGLDSRVFAPALLTLIRHARRLRPLALLLLLMAVLLLCLHRDKFWQTDLSSLSPIPAADQKLDQQLRRGVGAPDVRYLLAVRATDQQQALRASESLSRMLAPLIAQKALAGFDAPDRYLPSEALQLARQAALPDEALLRENLTLALSEFPFRAELFAPFLADVAQARTAQLLARETMPPSLALKLDTLLFARDGRWIAVLPLRAVANPQLVQSDLASLGWPDTAWVDLKTESDRLLQTYQHETATLAVIGSLVILALLAAALRSATRVFVVVAPLAAAVILTTALLTAGDQKLSIFNLVGLLLIVAVGSNYSLFFEQPMPDGGHRERMLASLVLANLCTVIGFGVLSFSRIPVLHDIGMTVAIGAFFSLVFPAVLGRVREREWCRDLGEASRHPVP